MMSVAVWALALRLVVEAPVSMPVVVAMPGGPGDTAAAKKPLKQFLDLWQAGQEEFSLDGDYFAMSEQADAYIQAQKPAVFVLSPALFFTKEKAHGLHPIAQLNVQGKTAEKWALVARKDAEPDWKLLKGKIIGSSLIADPFTKKLVAVGGIPLEGFATLEYNRSPLSAMRQVRDGTLPAVLLDEAQLLGLDKLPFGSDLKVLVRTDDMPLPIVAVAKQVPTPLRDKLKRAVVEAAKGDEAHKILMNFSVDGVSPSDDKLIASVRARIK